MISIRLLPIPFTANGLFQRKKHILKHSIPWDIADALVCHSSTMYFLYNCRDHSICWYGDEGGFFDADDGYAFPFFLVHPDDRDSLKSCWEQALAGQGTLPATNLKVIGQNGQYRYCRCHLVPLRDRYGETEKLLGYLVNMEDLWKRIHIQERERRFSRDTVSVLSGPYSMVSQIHMESGLCRCIKYGTPPLALADFFAPVNGDSTFRIPYSAYLESLAEHKVHQNFRREFLHKFSLKRLRNCLEKEPGCKSMALKLWDSENGCYRWSEAGFIPPIHPNGAATLFFMEINQNVTGEQTKEKACQTASELLEYIFTGLHGRVKACKKKAEFYAIAPHSGRIEGLSEYLDRILKNVQNIMNLQTSGTLLEESKFDISSLMQKCQIYFHSLRRDKSISYIWLGRLGGKYIGDENRLRQCLYILLENAILFNRKGGKVHVKMEQKKEEEKGCDDFSIEICDTGIGMTDKQQAYLFDSFTGREREAALKTVALAGLSLAVAKRIIDVLHGRLEVESELGKGTKVTVHFSLKRAT